MAFVRACAVAEIAPESAIEVEVDDVELALVQSRGCYYAIANECSHAAVPLSEGDVVDGQIECYLHGSLFDLKTGEPTGLPAVEKVAVYPVRLEGDDLLVDVSTPTNL